MSEAWTEQRLAKLKRMHAEGKSYSEMGAELGCSRNAISGKAWRFGLRRLSYDVGRWTPEEDVKLRRLYASGITHKKIGEALGRSKWGIEHRINKLGLGPRQRQNRVVHKAKPKPEQKPRTTALKLVKAAPALRLIMATPVQYNTALDGANVPLDQRKTLMELEHGDCRYPFGRPGTEDFFFCGGQSVTGGSYCQCHAKLCGRAYTGRVAA